MGFSPYGTLYPPFVALTASNSVKGFQAVGTGIRFGTVDAVNYANIKTNIGASCLFRNEDAMAVKAYGTNYYIVDEADLIFRENI